MMQQSEWKGSFPQRFSGGRKHINVDNEINLGFNLNSSRQASGGIKILPQSPTPEAVFKPHQKIFHEKYNEYTRNIDPRGIKPVTLPPQGQRKRPERLHICGGVQTEKQVDLKGVRPYFEANRSRDKHYFLENQLQRKTKIAGLECLRNSIGVCSMGDKPYKYPQYEADFYKNGGLIAGSTHKPRRHEIHQQIKTGSVLTKPNYDIRVKMDELAEERQYLDSIDNWEQTILKENNPNWKDPETFFEREDQGKEVKKAGKK